MFEHEPVQRAPVHFRHVQVVPVVAVAIEELLYASIEVVRRLRADRHSGGDGRADAQEKGAAGLHGENVTGSQLPAPNPTPGTSWPLGVGVGSWKVTSYCCSVPWNGITWPASTVTSNTAVR